MGRRYFKNTIPAACWGKAAGIVWVNCFIEGRVSSLEAKPNARRPLRPGNMTVSFYFRIRNLPMTGSSFAWPCTAFTMPRITKIRITMLTAR